MALVILSSLLNNHLFDEVLQASDLIQLCFDRSLFIFNLVFFVFDLFFKRLLHPLKQFKVGKALMLEFSVLVDGVLDMRFS